MLSTVSEARNPLTQYLRALPVRSVRGSSNLVDSIKCNAGHSFNVTTPSVSRSRTSSSISSSSSFKTIRKKSHHSLTGEEDLPSIRAFCFRDCVHIEPWHTPKDTIIKRAVL